MRRSTRERKTSRVFKEKSYDIAYEYLESSEEESEEVESSESDEENGRKSPKSVKRKIENVEVSTTKRRTKITKSSSLKYSGSIEYYAINDLKTTQLFEFTTNSEKGYHFETNKFSINNFAVGNYIYFFIKHSFPTFYDFIFKIIPNENKIEVLDKVFNIYPPFNEDFKNDFVKTYIKKESKEYPGVNAIFSSRAENHLELIFKDINSDKPFCTLNIESNEVI